MTTVEPAATGVRIPEFTLIVATPELLLTHLPPLVALVNVSLVPIQAVVLPSMAGKTNDGLTDKSKVDAVEQPLLVTV